jgi:error-prone DNA polymerase
VGVVKGISEELLGRIEAGRPFGSVADFWRRAEPRWDEAMALLRAGAFDGLGLSRTDVFWELRSMGARAGGEELSLQTKRTMAPPGRTEPGALERLRDEMELLGFTVGGHPVELFPEVAWDTYCRVADVRKFAGRCVTTCGLVVAQRTHRQSDGRAMKFISICDRTDILECEIFAGAYRAHGGILARHPVVEVSGRVQPSGDGCTLKVERVRAPR